MKPFILACAIAITSAGFGFAQAPPKVKVFVTTAGAVNGFTDPSKDNRDTQKDLREELRDQKSLLVVDRREDAAIILVVMGRETAQTTAGFLGSPARDRIIRVKFQFSDFETELTASAQGGTLGSGGAWGKAAGKIARQVEEWVVANRGKLSAAAGK
jgi:hypothetical protein